MMSLDKVEKYYETIIKERSAVVKRSVNYNTGDTRPDISTLYHLVGNALKFGKDRPIIQIGGGRLEQRMIYKFIRSWIP